MLCVCVVSARVFTCAHACERRAFFPQTLTHPLLPHANEKTQDEAGAGAGSTKQQLLLACVTRLNEAMFWSQVHNP